MEIFEIDEQMQVLSQNHEGHDSALETESFKVAAAMRNRQYIVE
jgi:hypothetical protein